MVKAEMQSVLEKFSLKNKLAFVTGGGTGIGLAISRAFLEAGARVVITGRREDVLKEACDALGKDAHHRTGDVSDLASLPGLVEEIESSLGAIDILVNNAGINLKKDFWEISNEECERIQRTNVLGLFALTREVVKKMIPRKRGVVLNITSMAAMYGLTRVAAYSASKSAVLGLTVELASELGPHGIRVNAIAPGFIFSAMTQKALDSDPERKAKVMGRTPMGRMGQAEEVAAAAVFLCSDAASFVTGVNLPVDGGNSIGF
jgi:NAD(P)-dependent dehydrogenase (short-subunit alcohol dehydrogenase family)